MPQIKCTQCHKPREVKYPKKCTSICRKCSDKNRDKTYVRVCEICGDKKETKNKEVSKCKKCKKCSAKQIAYNMSQNNRKDTTDRKFFTLVCSQCSKVRITPTNPDKYRKTTLCVYCSRRKSRGQNKPMKNKEDKVRHFRVCPDCEDCKQVTRAQNAGIKLCRRNW